jgi:hypothetical protein
VIDAIKRLRNRDGSPTKSRVANKERAGFLLYQLASPGFRQTCREERAVSFRGRGSPVGRPCSMRHTSTRPKIENAACRRIGSFISSRSACH